MSGGSRAAWGLLAANPKIAVGAVGMAAGISGEMADVPGGACVGIAGRSDPNYVELLWLEHKCRSHGMAYLFLDFDGGHDWAPRELVAGAMEWLDLQFFVRSSDLTDAQKKQRPKLIDQAIRKLAAAKPSLAGYEAAESLLADLKDDGDFAEKIQKLLDDLGPKLRAELDARKALNDAFVDARTKPTSYQEVVALQAEARTVAKEHANTMCGRRAAALVSNLQARLKLFPPEMRK